MWHKTKAAAESVLSCSLLLLMHLQKWRLLLKALLLCRSLIVQSLKTRRDLGQSRGRGSGVGCEGVERWNSRVRPAAAFPEDPDRCWKSSPAFEVFSLNSFFLEEVFFFFWGLLCCGSGPTSIPVGTISKEYIRCQNGVRGILQSVVELEVWLDLHPLLLGALPSGFPWVRGL